MISISKPGIIDYQMVDVLLNTYIDKLKAIYQAYLKGLFKPRIEESKYGVIFLDSHLYESFQIDILSKNINKSLSILETYTYSIYTFQNIENKYNIAHKDFNIWDIEDIYYYLIHINDIQLIKQHIVNGELLSIISTIYEKAKCVGSLTSYTK